MIEPVIFVVACAVVGLSLWLLVRGTTDPDALDEDQTLDTRGPD